MVKSVKQLNRNIDGQNKTFSSFLIIFYISVEFGVDLRLKELDLTHLARHT